MLAGNFWDKYTEVGKARHAEREADRKLREHQRYCQSLWQIFQMGERRAKAGLNSAPEKAWPEDLKAEYFHGFEYGKATVQNGEVL